MRELGCLGSTSRLKIVTDQAVSGTYLLPCHVQDLPSIVGANLSQSHSNLGTCHPEPAKAEVRIGAAGILL